MDVLSISIDLAEGLSFMHPEVVHRDLKPDNIMLTCHGRARIIGDNTVVTDAKKSASRDT